MQRGTDRQTHRRQWPIHILPQLCLTRNVTNELCQYSLCKWRCSLSSSNPTTANTSTHAICTTAARHRLHNCQVVFKWSSCLNLLQLRTCSPQKRMFEENCFFTGQVLFLLPNQQCQSIWFSLINAIHLFNHSRSRHVRVSHCLTVLSRWKPFANAPYIRYNSTENVRLAKYWVSQEYYMLWNYDTVYNHRSL